MKTRVFYMVMALVLTVALAVPLVGPSPALAADSTRVPTADGDVTGTWNTAPRWDDVDETTPNDADYMTGTDGGYCLFTFTAFDVPAGVTIDSLTVYIRGRETSYPGDSNSVERIKVNGSYYNGDTAHDFSSISWSTESYTWTTNPDTAAAWTVDDINGTGSNPLQQIGVYSDGSPDTRISMVYARVSYTLPCITRVPTADGSVTGTWNTAPRWDDVDETTPNDANYMTGTQSGHCLFTFTAFDVPAGATIESLTVYIRGRDTTTGDSDARERIRVNGIDYDGGTQYNFSSRSWTTESNTWTTNPNTGLAWTVADINGTGSNPLQQIGVYSDGIPATKISMVYAEVCYAPAPGPGINIDKYADETSVEAGQTIHYTYNVTNDTGLGNITGVTVTDDTCSPLSVPIKTGGNQDDTLEDNELWTYTCEYVTTLADWLAGSVDNEATADGTAPGAVPVQDKDTESVTVTSPTPAANPALAESCGMDVVLVLDSSDSISDLSVVKNAAKAFVSALLPATPSLIGVVEFDTNVVPTSLDLTDVVVNINNRIDAISHDGSTEYTNWEAALTEATKMLENTSPYSGDRDDTEHPDLIIIFTNGAPTASSAGTPDAGQPNIHLAPAILAANAAKLSTSDLPIRIVAAGVNDPGASALLKLQAISGTTVSPVPVAISASTDVITADFSDLADDLADLADECFDFGDAPEGGLAYPSGVVGLFPTCKTVGMPLNWIQHGLGMAHFAYLAGPQLPWDAEPDGDAGLCPPPGCFPTYDDDECYLDGDAGLIVPEPYTINATGALITCPNSTIGTPLGLTCQQAVWGTDVDIFVVNTMKVGFFVNVLMDWNQDGQWAYNGSTTCAAVPVPEHVLVDFPIPPGYSGPLSLVTGGPPLLPFQIGPNPGYVWTRFTISEKRVGMVVANPLSAGNNDLVVVNGVINGWHGEGIFEDGETEDYLLRIDEALPEMTIDKDVVGVAPVGVAPGGTVQYTINVTNSGIGTAINVSIWDTLPTWFTYASTDNIADTGTTRSPTVNPAPGATTPLWGYWDIPSGNSVVITFTADVDSNIPVGTYQNTAYADGDNFTQIDDIGDQGYDADTPPGQDPEIDENVFVAEEPPPLNGVPTLTQWGMIAMGILFAALLIWTVRRRWVVSADGRQE